LPITVNFDLLSVLSLITLFYDDNSGKIIKFLTLLSFKSIKLFDELDKGQMMLLLDEDSIVELYSVEYSELFQYHH